MLQSIPEELIERILALASLQAPQKVVLNPQRGRKPVLALSSGSKIRTNVLLSSKTLYRIGLPLYYANVQLQNRTQAASLCRTLHDRPELRRYVRKVSVAGVWAEAASILHMCSASISCIEYTMDRQSSGQLTWGASAGDIDADEGSDDVNAFCRGLQALRQVRELTVRKAPNLYVTSPRARVLIQETSNAIMKWFALSDVQMLFTLPDDLEVGGLPYAIASRPHLRSLTTCLPSVWNHALVAISENRTLQRVTLLPSSSPRGSVDFTLFNHSLSSSKAVLSTGLFLSEARRHPRLDRLIVRGTNMLRT